jgi:hypothetical protein
VFFLAALAVVEIWAPFGWWRVLATGGAILSLLLLAAFFGATKPLPMALDPSRCVGRHNQWDVDSTYWLKEVTSTGRLGLYSPNVPEKPYEKWFEQRLDRVSGRCTESRRVENVASWPV